MNKPNNIALLSDKERRDIELNRQAALLIHDLKIGKINRPEINKKINKLNISEQDKFKEMLNKYRTMK